MTNPLEHIRKHPKLAKQIIGLTLPQLEQLIKQALAKNEQRKKAAEDHKIRVILVISACLIFVRSIV